MEGGKTVPYKGRGYGQSSKRSKSYMKRKATKPLKPHVYHGAAKKNRKGA